MAEYLQAPPRRKALGLLADALTSGQEALNTVNLPYVGGLGGLLFGQAPQYLQDVSYGMPLLRGGNVATGGLGTLTPDTRMLDVATLPFVGAGAAKAGQVGAKTLGKEVARQVETGTGLLGSRVMNPRANIVPIDVAKQFDMPTTLPNKTEFTEAVSNTPGASITPEGLLVNVSRFQKPEQELAESVRTGVFYLPTGSQQAKYYKGKGSIGGSYGGTQEVVGDTLYKNPLFVRGGTGGKAPEDAYKQLVGKEQYDNMQKDLMSAIQNSTDRKWPQTINHSKRGSEAYMFLEKYAPEIADNAFNISENSTKGNQFIMALKEAVFANEARKAGYDSVIGYSTGRKGKGNFLSEIFDVRENLYPSPSGEYGLTSEFEGLLKR